MHVLLEKSCINDYQWGTFQHAMFDLDVLSPKPCGSELWHFHVQTDTLRLRISRAAALLPVCTFRKFRVEETTSSALSTPHSLSILS